MNETVGAEMKTLEKEAVKKLSGFVDNKERGWTLWRNDLQNMGGDNSGGYDKAGVEHVLQEIDLAICRADGYEIGVVLEQDGRFVMARSGATGTVDLAGVDLGGRRFTHNHPSGAKGNSYADVRALVNNDMYELRTVVSDRRFGSLVKEGQGSGDFAGDYKKEFGDGYDGKLLMVTKEALSEAGINEPSMSEMIQKAESLVNKWLYANAIKYGYHFVEGVYELR